jgi:hypothetical protein
LPDSPGRRAAEAAPPFPQPEPIVIPDLLLIGLAITLEPPPLTVFLMVLASERGVRKGAAFVFGWLMSLAIVIALTGLATGNNPPGPRAAPSSAVLAIKIAAGAALLVIALRQRRRMGRPKKPGKISKWLARIDRMPSWYAVVIAALVQPWPLVAAGAVIVAEARLSATGTYLSLVLFCLIATSSVLVIEIHALFWPERSHVLLNRLKAWMDTHAYQVIIIVTVVLGLWLIGKSSYLLAT